MKINELKRIAEENEYKQLENKHNQLKDELEFRRNAGELENIVNRIAIREGIENRIFFDINYCDEKDFNMIKAAVEFAETPLEDREEEKKFYAKHRYLQSSLTNSNNILCYSVSDDKLALCNGINFLKYKTYLTLKEIEEIKKKFNTDLKDFELVEVEE